MIATLSETTAGPFLVKLRDEMLKTESGRLLLKERPRITTKTIDMAALRAMPDGSFGRAYVDWLDWCKVTPDTRDPVGLFL
jgi:ubiquinone biosynthesis protein COQ4